MSDSPTTSAASLLSRLRSSYHRHCAGTFRREARRGIWFAVNVGVGREGARG